MISPNLLIKQADKDGVPAPTVERDYVLAHILAGITLHPHAERLVFKGGTALRMCYFTEYRYSADLDFSLVDAMTTGEALSVIGDSLSATTEQIGFPQLALTDHDKPRIVYQGPLGRERLLKLDLADDELVGTPTNKPLLRRYPDQPEASIKVYSLEEVVAEKLRCVIQRVQCRDLFDLNELLVNNAIPIDEAWDMFERKARHRNIDPAVFSSRFDERLVRYRRLWIDELEQHVPDDPPPFESTERAVRRALRGHLG